LQAVIASGGGFMPPCGFGGTVTSPDCAAETPPVIRKRISIILMKNLFMLSPSFIFHYASHIFCCLMKSILAGKCGANMEEMRKFSVMNFIFQSIVRW
jgi:hypothetical protein